MIGALLLGPMLQYHNANVSFSDKTHTALKAATVTVIGENPNCTAKVSARTENGSRFATVDRLLNATVDTKGKQVKITGRSEFLRTQVESEDDLVTITITPGAKTCKDC